MTLKNKIALYCILTVTTLSLTGCEEDDKQVAADVIDSAGSAINHIMDKAPSGEQIVGAVEDGLDAVGEVVNSITNTAERNATRHENFVEDTLGVED